MTINDINKILSRLVEQPSKEHVLDLSFALLQWMNIEPNPAEGGRNKPQLLSLNSILHNISKLKHGN